MTNDEARELVRELQKLVSKAQKVMDRLWHQQGAGQDGTADVPVDESDIGKEVEVRHAENGIWQKRTLCAVNRNERCRLPYVAYSKVDRGFTHSWKYARRIPVAAQPAPPRDVEPTEKHIGKLVFVRDKEWNLWRLQVLHGIDKSRECSYLSGRLDVSDETYRVYWRYARLPYPGELNKYLPVESQEGGDA